MSPEGWADRQASGTGEKSKGGLPVTFDEILQEIANLTVIERKLSAKQYGQICANTSLSLSLNTHQDCRADGL